MSTGIYFSQHTLHEMTKIQRLLNLLQPEAAPQAAVISGSPEPRGTVIVFPGSFNPPTNAHLALLKQAYQLVVQQHMLNGRLKSPIYLFAALSKHTVDKEQVERPLMLDRIMLLNSILKKRLPHAGIMLFNRGLYVEEAEAVHRSFPRVQRLLFLLGYDKIVQILDPRYYEDRDQALHELFALAELLVAPRGDAGPEELEALLHRPENQQFARFIHPLPFSSAYRTISSSRVRSQTQAHEQDVPHEVREFMRTTRAYAPPVLLADGTQHDYYAERVRRLQQLLRM